MKDIRSLLLVLLSTGLVATWVYHIYDKARYSKASSTAAPATDTAALGNMRDSLQRVYSEKISNLDLKLDSTRSATDSLQIQLTQRVGEINRLKSQISTVLKNPNSSAAQLKEARQMMSELEERVEELHDQNETMESEKKDLTVRLEQITGEAGKMEQNIRRLDEENKDLREKIKAASVFMVSAIHFAAIDLRNDKELETIQSKKADKFVTSFILQNNVNSLTNAEVFVVITEPDGHVLQNSTWNSGTFDTKSESKKTFTRRIRFDYEKGEQKQVIFSLDNADNFQKGKYTLQLWYMGVLIGQSEKDLH
jgi:TolA-binding protein